MSPQPISLTRHIDISGTCFAVLRWIISPPCEETILILAASTRKLRQGLDIARWNKSTRIIIERMNEPLSDAQEEARRILDSYDSIRHAGYNQYLEERRVQEEAAKALGEEITEDIQSILQLGGLEYAIDGHMCVLLCSVLRRSTTLTIYISAGVRSSRHCALWRWVSSIP